VEETKVEISLRDYMKQLRDDAHENTQQILTHVDLKMEGLKDWVTSSLGGLSGQQLVHKEQFQEIFMRLREAERRCETCEKVCVSCKDKPEVQTPQILGRHTTLITWGVIGTFGAILIDIICRIYFKV
jgi:hypothetical protein